MTFLTKKTVALILKDRRFYITVTQSFMLRKLYEKVNNHQSFESVGNKNQPQN